MQSVKDSASKLSGMYSTLTTGEKLFVGSIATMGVISSLKLVKSVVLGLKDITSEDHSRESYTNAPIKHEIFPQYFLNGRGQWIYRRTWNNLPSEMQSQPRGVVVLLHGAMEHVGRYEHVANFLNSIGLIVCGMDHHGHGFSDGDRFYTKDFEHYVDDAVMLIDKVRAEFCSVERSTDDSKSSQVELPLYLLGHSMGGLITLATALRLTRNGQAEAKITGGLLVSAPALGAVAEGVSLNPENPFINQFMLISSRLTPRLRLAEIKNDKLSHIKAIPKKAVTDPCHFCGMGPARTSEQLITAGREVFKNIEQLQLPYLLMHGNLDVTVHIGRIEEMYERTRDNNKLNRAYILEGGYHEIFNEVDQIRNDAFQYMSEWITEREQFKLQSV